MFGNVHLPISRTRPLFPSQPMLCNGGGDPKDDDACSGH